MDLPPARDSPRNRRSRRSLSEGVLAARVSRALDRSLNTAFAGMDNRAAGRTSRDPDAALICRPERTPVVWNGQILSRP